MRHSLLLSVAPCPSWGAAPPASCSSKCRVRTDSSSSASQLVGRCAAPTLPPGSAGEPARLVPPLPRPPGDGLAAMAKAAATAGCCRSRRRLASPWRSRVRRRR